MNNRDIWIVGGAVLVAIFAGIWVHIIVGAGGYDTDVAVSLIDDILDYFTLVAAVTALGLVYQARAAYGGDMARSLAMIGVGLLLYVPTYWVSYRWAIEGNPLWFGMTTGFWSLLFGLLTIFTFGYVAYGFYLMWHTGKK